MQRVTCTVRLSGDVGNTVQKTGVSPAEIVILRDLHGGPEAVIDIQPNSMDKVPHGTERARLVDIYGQHVVDRIFPGQFSQLPVSLKDIEIAVPDEDEEEDQTDAGSEDPLASLDDDDKALVELVQGAKSKSDLYSIAKDNEVDLKPFEDKMDALKAGILSTLFPSFRK